MFRICSGYVQYICLGYVHYVQDMFSIYVQDIYVEDRFSIFMLRNSRKVQSGSIHPPQHFVNSFRTNLNIE